MTQVVNIGVTSLTFEWTTSMQNFCDDQTPVFQFLGYSWYIECFVNDHDVYRITLQNSFGNERIRDSFYVTTFLKVNHTAFLQSVKNVQDPRRRLWEFHESDIAAYIAGFDFNDEFTVVCQFAEEPNPFGQEIWSETSTPLAQGFSRQARTPLAQEMWWSPRTAGSLSTDFDESDYNRAVSSCSSVIYPPKGKRLLDKSVQTSLELPPALESLSLDFCNLLKNEEIPDVQLKCGTRVFPAHRAVLAARSEVFADMFRSKMAESQTGIVDVTDLDEHVLEIFLKYIYTGRTSTPTDDVLPKLYVAANKYAVNTLKRACSEWMIGSLTTENCLDILKLADTHSDQYLEAAVMNFVVGDMELLNSEAWCQFEMEHPILALGVYRAVFKGLGIVTSK